MLDDINVKLIDICEEYLDTHKIGLDKYQLAMVVMDLYTQTISSIDEPFKVIAKENKQLIQDYLEKNKQKRETLERIKSENEALDKEIAIKKREQKEKKVDFVTEPEMPSGNSEAGAMGPKPPSPKPKKNKARWVDAYAIENFYLPWIN